MSVNLRTIHYTIVPLIFLGALCLVLLHFTTRIPEFSSQNAYYHAHFANQAWTSSDPPIVLEKSLFNGQFIDQHLGFHLLLGLLQFHLDPLAASKMLPIICVFLIGLIVLAQSPAPDRLVSIVLFSTLFVAFESSLDRLFWGRPQIVTLTGIFAIQFFAWKERWIPAWLIALAVSFVSFESTILIGFNCGLQFLFFPNQRKFAFATATSVLLGLFCFPFGLEKLRYFQLQLSEHAFSNSGIHEWRSFRRVEWLPSLSLVGVLALAIWTRETFHFRRCFLIAWTLVALTLSIFAVRFSYLFAFFVILLILEFASVYRRTLALVFLVLAISAAAYAPPFQPPGDVKNNFRNTAWRLSQMNPNARILNYRWENWSSLLFHAPNLRTEPGFSLALYDHKPEILRAYRKMRQDLELFTRRELKELLEYFEADYILVDRQTHDRSHSFFEFQLGLTLVFANREAAVYQWAEIEKAQSDFEAKKAMAFKCALDQSCKSRKPMPNSGLVQVRSPIHETALEAVRSPLFRDLVEFLPNTPARWVYTFKIDRNRITEWPRGLPPLDVSYVIHIGSRFVNAHAQPTLDELFYELNGESPAPNEHTSRTRRLGGLLAICHFREQQHRCEEILKSIGDISKWNVGSLANLGLALLTPSGSRFPDLMQKVLKTIDQKYESHLEGRAYIFNVGEALTFLNSQRTFSSHPFLQRDLREYTRRFWEDQDHFYVRWLLSALYYAHKQNPQVPWPKDEARKVVEWLSERRTLRIGPSDSRGCYLNARSGIGAALFTHTSGLMAEGLSYWVRGEEFGEWPLFQTLLTGYLNCASKLQVRLENHLLLNATPADVGGFQMILGRPQLQIDVFGHAMVGFLKSARDGALDK